MKKYPFPLAWILAIVLDLFGVWLILYLLLHFERVYGVYWNILVYAVCVPVLMVVALACFAFGEVLINLSAPIRIVESGVEYGWELQYFLAWNEMIICQSISEVNKSRTSDCIIFAVRGEPDQLTLIERIGGGPVYVCFCFYNRFFFRWMFYLLRHMICEIYRCEFTVEDLPNQIIVLHNSYVVEKRVCEFHHVKQRE